MNKFKFIFFLLSLTVADVWASPYVSLGYATEGTGGYGDAGGVVTPWVSFDAETMATYTGNAITKVCFETNSKASNVYVYIRRDREDSENLYRQKIGSLEAGKHEIVLDVPYELTDCNPVAIGYKATFISSGGAVFGEPKEDAACHVYYNTKNSWVEVNGSFCISAIVEGETLPANELSVVSLESVVMPYNATEASLPLTVRNMGTEPVNSFSVGRVLDGETLEDVVFDGLAIEPGSRQTVDVRFTSPGVGKHLVEVGIRQVNGRDDAFADNNHAEATFTERDSRFIRRVVAEEATGTWCGACPRGIVGFEMMAEKYPDTFIGVAVHGGDDIFTVESLSPALAFTNVFPNSRVNRHLVGDPYDDIEGLYMREVVQPAAVGYNTVSVIGDDDIITVTSTVTATDEQIKGSNLLFSFTVVEDKLLGMQTNSYSGSETPMGGWEQLPSPTPCMYNDVARAAYPSYEGEQMFTQALAAGESYEFDTSFALPDNVADKANIKIVSQVIDKSNGFILNAHRTVPTIISGVVDRSMEAEVIRTEAYTVDGRLIMATDGALTDGALSHSGIDGLVIVREYTDRGVNVTKRIVRN